MTGCYMFTQIGKPQSTIVNRNYQPELLGMPAITFFITWDYRLLAVQIEAGCVIKGVAWNLRNQDHPTQRNDKKSDKDIV